MEGAHYLVMCISLLGLFKINPFKYSNIIYPYFILGGAMNLLTRLGIYNQSNLDCYNLLIACYLNVSCFLNKNSSVGISMVIFSITCSFLPALYAPSSRLIFAIHLIGITTLSFLALKTWRATWQGIMFIFILYFMITRLTYLHYPVSPPESILKLYRSIWYQTLLRGSTIVMCAYFIYGFNKIWRSRLC